MSDWSNKTDEFTPYSWCLCPKCLQWHEARRQRCLVCFANSGHRQKSV